MMQRGLGARDAGTWDHALPGPALLCSVKGCGRTVWEGRDGMCSDCAAMDAEYDEYYSEQQHRRRRQIATWLENTAWLLALMALLGALAYELWPYLWLVFELWFGNLGDK